MSDFDLVVTDQAMPGMTGLELAAAIRRSWPALPVIIATGYAELMDQVGPSLPRLLKPYRQQDLAELIASLVAEQPISPAAELCTAAR